MPNAPKKLALLALAWPIFVEQLLHLSTGFADTVMVSHVSDGAVAALGMANNLIFVCVIIFGMVAVGASVVITHHLGAKDRAGADDIARTAIGTSTWVGLVTSILVCVFAQQLLNLVQLSPALQEYALPFLRIMGATLFVEAIIQSMCATLRAHGFTRVPMVVTLGQNLLNVAGNSILLFGLLGAPKMGVVGVAMSTVFSRFVACAVLWVLLRKRVGIRLHWRDFIYLPRERLNRILHIGVPSAGEPLCWSIAFMTLTAFTARMGDAQLATQTYTMQLVFIMVISSMAIGSASEIMMGHLIGAGEFEHAQRQLLRNFRVGLAITMVVATIVTLLSPWILGLLSKDPVIIAGGVLLMRIGLLIEPGRVFNIVLINGLRATGDARYPVLVGICSMFTLMAGGSWLLGTYFGMGLVGVWIAMMADEWLRGILMYRRWKQRKWLPYAQATYAKVSAGKPLPTQEAPNPVPSTSTATA
jgi:putative MATE family efflux protein